jgi:hypothetical protein
VTSTGLLNKIGFNIPSSHEGSYIKVGVNACCAEPPYMVSYSSAKPCLHTANPNPSLSLDAERLRKDTRPFFFYIYKIGELAHRRAYCTTILTASKRAVHTVQQSSLLANSYGQLTPAARTSCQVIQRNFVYLDPHINKQSLSPKT